MARYSSQLLGAEAAREATVLRSQWWCRARRQGAREVVLWTGEFAEKEESRARSTAAHRGTMRSVSRGRPSTQSSTS